MEEAAKGEILGRQRCRRPKEAADADRVIEAVVESREVKQVFQELDAICKEDAILASNTSSISITEIAIIQIRPTALSACTL